MAKSIETPYSASSESFKVIDVDMTKKLVISACCNRHIPMHICNIFMKNWPTTIK